MQIHPIIKTSPSLSSLSWGPSAPPYTILAFQHVPNIRVRFLILGSGNPRIRDLYLELGSGNPETRDGFKRKIGLFQVLGDEGINTIIFLNLKLSSS